MSLGDTAFGGRNPGSGDEEQPSADGLNVDRAVDMLNMKRSERIAALFDFEPWGFQAEVLDADVNRRIWVCGRQVGKTETAGAVPADWALTHPGEDALIAAQYQETADELFARTKDHFDRLGDPGTVGVEKPNTKTYTLDTGGRVLSRTLGGGEDDEAANQRGKLPSCIVVEEAALIHGDVFDKVLRPMFATHDDYLLLLISTPRGRRGYLWDKWKSADGEKWETWRAETSDSPKVADDWLREVKEDVDTLTFDQEYRGRFVETGDEYLPPSLVDPSVGPVSLEDTEPSDGPLYLGLDPARGGDDREVYTFMDSSGTVFDLKAFETSTTPESVRRVKAYDRIHGFRKIAIEENGHGGGIVDYATEDLPNILPVTTSLESKATAYKSLKTAFEGGELSLPAEDTEETKRLRNEVTSLTYTFSKNGKVQVSHPPGGHDDFPDSLAFAYRAKSVAEEKGERNHVEQRDRPTTSKRNRRKVER